MALALVWDAVASVTTAAGLDRGVWRRPFRQQDSYCSHHGLRLDSRCYMLSSPPTASQLRRCGTSCAVQRHRWSGAVVEAAVRLQRCCPSGGSNNIRGSTMSVRSGAAGVRGRGRAGTGPRALGARARGRSGAREGGYGAAGARGAGARAFGGAGARVQGRGRSGRGRAGVRGRGRAGTGPRGCGRSGARAFGARARGRSGARALGQDAAR